MVLMLTVWDLTPPTANVLGSVGTDKFTGRSCCSVEAEEVDDAWLGVTCGADVLIARGHRVRPAGALKYNNPRHFACDTS